MKNLSVPILAMALLALSCSSDKNAADVHGPAADVIPETTGAEIQLETSSPEVVPDVPLETAPEDMAVDDLSVTPDLPEADAPSDVPGTEDAGADIDDLTPEDDVVSDLQSDLPAPECVEAEDCQTALGAPETCKQWACNDETCFQVDINCDDQDICTEDFCDPEFECVNKFLAPEACVDDEGNPGIKECVEGAWGDCQGMPGCNLKVNTNDTGTVNPFIFPAREGQFYVSYVASEDEGGNMKLAWVDPFTCSVTNGPFTVNETPGAVYYWGAQWALSDGAGNFYAVWEAKSGMGEVRFAHSQSGEEFANSVEVVTTSDNGIHPALAVVVPGHVAVTWSGFIDSNAPAGFEYDPFFAANPSTFGDNEFSTGKQVAATAIQDDSTAVVIDPAGNVYVGWESFQDGSPEGGNVYVAKSADGGATFGAPVQVNDVNSKANVGISSFLAFGYGRLFVVWSDDRTDYEGDVYIDSAEPDLIFGDDVMVNDSTYRYQEDPTVVVAQGSNCNGSVYVVWQDLRSNDGYDIYGAKSVDLGASFEPNIQVNPEDDSEDQMNPALAVDAGCVVGATWRDNVAGNQFDVHTTFMPVW